MKIEFTTSKTKLGQGVLPGEEPYVMKPYRAQCIPTVPEKAMSVNRRRSVKARNPERYNMPEAGKATRMYQCTVNETLVRAMLARLREAPLGEPVRLVEAKTTRERDSDWNYQEQRRQRAILTPAVRPKRKQRLGRRQRIEARLAREAEAETQPLSEQSKPEDKNKDDKTWEVL